MKQHHKSAAENSDQATGSSKPDEPVFLVVGKLRRPHGLNGEILLEIMTDFPERLTRGKEIYVGDSHVSMRIQKVREHETGLLITLLGVSDRESAARYTNQLVFVKASQLPSLGEGQYYHHELLGMLVNDESGNYLGKVREIIETGANDVLVLENGDGKETLLPAIEQVILSVNVESQLIVVKLPEWA